MAINLNDTLPVAPSGGVNVKFQEDVSGNVSAYVDIVPILASVDLVGQTAAIASTLLYSVVGDGLYRITWSADITTQATTSSVLGGTNGFQILATSPTDSVVKTFPRTITSGVNTDSTNSLDTGISGVITVFAENGTDIEYQMDYTSVGGTSMEYELHIRCEKL